jgi:OOP family OmpA-OmpF porin
MSSNAKIFCATMIAVSVCFALSFAANAQNLLTKSDLVDGLVGLETTPNIDVAALRARALDRIKKNINRDPVNRPAIAEQLYNLPQLTLEIQFNLNSAIINPNSYPALGRIADAMYHPILSGYRFLVVGHTDSTGKREHNLGLSQRRAEAIRDALVTTFRIPPQRVQAVGLGEEQFQDKENPTAPINRRVQIVTIGKSQ